MNFSERPLIITDVETTGLLAGYHEIIEIGAIKVNQKLEELDRFDQKIYPMYLERATPEALAVNGFTVEGWANARYRNNVFADFANFAADGVLAAWNITFEYSFLKEIAMGLVSADVLARMDYHRIDIPSIAWYLLPFQEKFSMDRIAEGLGIPPEPTPHRGITGAEYELEILRRLRERR